MDLGNIFQALTNISAAPTNFKTLVSGVKTDLNAIFQSI